MVWRAYQNGRKTWDSGFQTACIFHLLHFRHRRRFLSYLPRPRLYTLGKRYVYHAPTERFRPVILYFNGIFRNQSA